MIEEMLSGVAGALLGGGLTRYFSAAKVQLREADRLTDDTPALLPAVVPPPVKLRVREFVCQDGQRICAHEREERYYTPPADVLYTIDREEDQ